MTRSAPHIVIDGLYGIQSYGDDAMLLSIIENLPKLIPLAKFTVLCRHPSEVTARYGIAAIHNLDHPEWVRHQGYWFYDFNDQQPRDHIERLRSTIAASDLLVIGGGNLLLDITDDWLRGPIAWHWFSSEIARIYQVPYMVFANSVGPFRTDWGRARSAHILRNAAATTLRDEASLRLVQQMGINGEHVELLPDPALAARPEDDAAAEILSALRNSSFQDSLRVAVSVRDLSWQLDSSGVERYLASFQRLCDRLIDEFGARIIFIPQCSYQHGDPAEDDRNIARQLTARMRNKERTYVLGGQYRAGAVMGLYRRVDIALTTRLHGAVFSAAAGTPFLAISYLPKVQGFVRHVGMDEWSLSVDEFEDEETVFRKVTSLIARRKEIAAALREAVRHAQNRAQKHFEIMARLLGYANQVSAMSRLKSA